MKAITTFLGVALLLGLYVLVRNSFAQPNDRYCDGPFSGCGSDVTCLIDSGNCEDNGPTYDAYSMVSAPLYDCAWASEESCYDDDEPVIACHFKYYKIDPMTGECDMDTLIITCEPVNTEATTCSQ